MSRAGFEECFLLVPDLERARDFYEGALGLSPATSGSDSVTYDVAGTPLKLQADYPEDVFEAFNLDRPSPTGRGRGTVLALELAEDIEEVYRRVVESEGTALFEPRDVDWLEGEMFLAEDPVGYTIEIR